MTLRVDLQIVPFGNEDERYSIGTINISNFGRTEEPGVCRYKFEVNRQGYGDKIILHKRSDGAGELVRKVLAECDI